MFRGGDKLNNNSNTKNEDCRFLWTANSSPSYKVIVVGNLRSGAPDCLGVMLI